MKCLMTQKFHHNYNVGIKAQVMNFIVGYQIRIEVTMQLCQISCTHYDASQLYQSHHYFGLMNF